VAFREAWRFAMRSPPSCEARQAVMRSAQARKPLSCVKRSGVAGSTSAKAPLSRATPRRPRCAAPDRAGAYLPVADAAAAARCAISRIASIC
jgi:hypothetical protein